ncbi:MAG: NAD(P)H-dependent oxidoreductase subunit E [Ferrimicrobium sp.]
MTASTEQSSAYDVGRVRDLAEEGAHARGPLLEILHSVQQELGYVDDTAIAPIADVLNLSRAEVLGVVSFYRDFRRQPPAQATIRLCRGEACQSVGAEGLVAHACERLGVGVGESSEDGRVSLDQVFCLGNCALGPSGVIDGRLVGRLDEATLDELLAPYL